MKGMTWQKWSTKLVSKSIVSVFDCHRHCHITICHCQLCNIIMIHPVQTHWKLTWLSLPIAFLKVIISGKRAGCLEAVHWLQWLFQTSAMIIGEKSVWKLGFSPLCQSADFKVCSPTWRRKFMTDPCSHLLLTHWFKCKRNPHTVPGMLCWSESPFQLACEGVLVVPPHHPLLLLLPLLLALHAPLIRPPQPSSYPFFLLLDLTLPIVAITTLDVHQLHFTVHS